MRVDGYLDVSEKLAAKIASGEVRIITEAVARKSDARIYEYVPFVTTLTEDKNDNTVNKVLNVSNKKNCNWFGGRGVSFIHYCYCYRYSLLF